MLVDVNGVSLAGEVVGLNAAAELGVGVVRVAAVEEQGVSVQSVECERGVDWRGALSRVAGSGDLRLWVVLYPVPSSAQPPIQSLNHPVIELHLSRVGFLLNFWPPLLLARVEPFKLDPARRPLQLPKRNQLVQCLTA